MRSRTPWYWTLPWAVPPIQCCTCWLLLRKRRWISICRTWMPCHARCRICARWHLLFRPIIWRMCTVPVACLASWGNWIVQDLYSTMCLRCMPEPWQKPWLCGMCASLKIKSVAISTGRHQVAYPLQWHSVRTSATRTWIWIGSRDASVIRRMRTARMVAWLCCMVIWRSMVVW